MTTPAAAASSSSSSSTPTFPPGLPVPPQLKAPPFKKPPPKGLSLAPKGPTPAAPAAPKGLKAPAVKIPPPVNTNSREVLAALPTVATKPNEPSADFLAQQPDEDADSYQIRVKYYRAALANLASPQGVPIDEETARLYGRLAINRAKDKFIRYPSKLEQQMSFLDSKV